VAFLPLRTVPLPEATGSAYDDWITSVDESLSDPACDRDELCRRILTEIYFPDLLDADLDGLTGARRVALLQMDPRNVTLEPEYYQELEEDRYARVKPLIWLWEMFDKSPLGENVHLGVRFRRVLAKRIFRSCGENFKAFHFVKLSMGYNLDVGDDVVIHRHVLLDDRGGIRIGSGSSVSDFVNVYSHSHDVVDACEVATPVTTIGRGVRLAYHATVLAGVNIADDTLVGAHATVTKDTEAHGVYVGSPARKVREKPDRKKKAAPADPLADVDRTDGACL
jgi:acetyltransferase-like isoleucine patch superfamily enzyme